MIFAWEVFLCVVLVVVLAASIGGWAGAGLYTWWKRRKDRR